MTKREKLARAAHDAAFTGPDLGGADAMWLRAVDAILAELREPDDRMREAGQGAMPVESDYW